MSDYWSQYWQQGHLTSFGKDIQQNYRGKLADDWVNWVLSCGARKSFIDIGCGNGALIDLMVSHAPELATWTGIDSASLTLPENLSANEMVSFLEQTSAEKLPLENNSIDVVVSQFGIEYADLKKAINEVQRVLVPKGICRFVLHDPDSIIIKPNLQILNAAKAVMEAGGAYETLQQLIQCLNDLGPNSDKTEASRNRLNQCVGDLSQIHQQALFSTEFPAFLKAVMHPARSFAQRSEMLSLFENETRNLIVRLEALTAAALDQNAREALYRHMQKIGLNVSKECSQLDEQKSLLGWVVEGRKTGL